MRTFLHFIGTLCLILLPSCIFHKHVEEETNPDCQTVVTVVVKANNLTEDGTVSTHNDEIFCALFNTSHDSIVSVHLAGCRMFNMDSVGQKTQFTSGPLGETVTGDLVVMLFEMDTDSSVDAMARIVDHNYYTLAHALHVNDQQTIHRILGDDDFLGMHIFPAEKVEPKKPTTCVVEGQQFFNRFSFSITLEPWYIYKTFD